MEINVTCKPGYQLDELTVTYADGEKSCVLTQTGDNKFTFVMPAANVLVEATFAETAYTADLKVTGGAKATLNGYFTYNMNADYLETVTVNVTPDEGWQLESITVTDAAGNDIAINEAIKAAGGDYTFTMPHDDVVVDVVLVKTVYTITTSANADHGAVTTKPAGKAVKDDVVEVNVTCKPGYQLDELIVTYADGKKSCVPTQTGDNKFTFVMPAANVLVEAIFTETTYTADLKVTGDAKVTLNGYFTVNMNADYLETVTVNVAPAEGWQLESITVTDKAGNNIAINEAIKAAGGDYTFTMPENDVVVNVVVVKTTFDLEAFAINFFEDGHGTVTLNPAKSASVGDKVDIMADPDDGYRVKKVTVTDAEGNAVPVSFVSEEATYEQVWSFTMPASAVDVTVIFEVQGSSFYTDVRTDFWCYDAVTFVTDRGYFKGFSNELFGPFINMDRAMFVTVLGRLYGVDPADYTGNVTFDDVVADSYYAPYVAWAVENGIVLGYNEDEFRPHNDITREEMVTIMYRYSKFAGIDVTPQNAIFMDRYEDLDLISGYAEDAVKWAVGVGLIRGRTETTINPLNTACRAEVAQVIKNFCDKVIAP